MDKQYINPMISSMAGRLGIYNGAPKVDDPTLNIQDSVNTAIDGVHQQSSLLNLYGGHAQQERMIQDKKRSLDRALRYSYQGATVRDIETEESYRALINPNKVKLDYDEKVISINWESRFRPGTVFEWQETNTHWLIMYQDLTELAYFKGDCRKCHYQVQWFDKSRDQIFTTYASVIGPKESVKSMSQSGASIDIANYTLNILIPSTETTLAYFDRSAKFMLNGMKWKVIQADSISAPGIIQLTAKEDYNTGVDEIPQDEENEEIDMIPLIEGNEVIRPKVEYKYTCNATGDWKISGIATSIEVIHKDANSITLKWNRILNGEFVLHKGDNSKAIQVRIS